MPSISMFYGVIIYMYFFDGRKHKKPRVHAGYAEYTVALSTNGVKGE